MWGVIDSFKMEEILNVAKSASLKVQKMSDRKVMFIFTFFSHPGNVGNVISTFAMNQADFLEFISFANVVADSSRSSFG